MSNIKFPSSEFPAFPGVTIELPEGWTGTVLPGTVLAAILDCGAEAFSPNLVVAVSRGVGTRWEDAEAAVDSYVDGLTAVERASRERPIFGGQPWSVLEFAHVTTQVGTLFQVIAVTLVENGPVVDTVRLTATVAPDRLTEVLPVVRRMISAAEITVR